MEVRNTTRRPLKVPLPGGKRLFLTPGNTGQIAPRAAEHPPVKALIDGGELEVLGQGRTQGGDASSRSSGKGPGRGPTEGGVRHIGDR